MIVSLATLTVIVVLWMRAIDKEHDEEVEQEKAIAAHMEDWGAVEVDPDGICHYVYRAPIKADVGANRRIR